MQFTIQRKQLRAILNFAAVKDIRYYLNGLHVRQDHRGTILEATDGHALGMLRIDDSPKPVASCIMRTEHVKALLGSRKDGDQYIDFNVSEAGDVTASACGLVYTFKKEDAAFPDTQRVTPKDSQEDGPAQFDVNLLAKFAQCAIDLEVSKKGHFGLRHRGANNPGLVDIGLDSFVGVVMPLRQETPAGIPPAWVHKPVIDVNLEPVTA